VSTGALSLGVKRPGRESENFHLVPRLRKRGAIPPPPKTPSWRGAQLKSYCDSSNNNESNNNNTYDHNNDNNNNCHALVLLLKSK
jgi:hypothetical protein